VQAVRDLQEEIYEINVANGWYDSERAFGDCIALLHTEVSEAYEAYRMWGTDDMTDDLQQFDETGTIPKPEGVGSEFADVFIRLLDTARRHGIDLEAEVMRKNAFNRTRGYRHGGKRV
jgi:NTP pyrophosphatase (non-canonical NTP hydrolase)